MLYLITRSARRWKDGGNCRPSALAALRLIANVNFVGCNTGRSARAGHGSLTSSAWLRAALAPRLAVYGTTVNIFRRTLGAIGSSRLKGVVGRGGPQRMRRIGISKFRGKAQREDVARPPQKSFFHTPRVSYIFFQRGYILAQDRGSESIPVGARHFGKSKGDRE